MTMPRLQGTVHERNESDIIGRWEVASDPTKSAVSIETPSKPFVLVDSSLLMIPMGATAVIVGVYISDPKTILCLCAENGEKRTFSGPWRAAGDALIAMVWQHNMRFEIHHLKGEYVATGSFRVRMIASSIAKVNP